jgi:non-ribosomal peptide synthetase component F
LPLRVTLPDQKSIIDWLHDLQDTNLNIRQYEHTPLNLIHGWTEISSGAPIFHILFDFENYPVKEKKDSLQLKMTRSEERVDYPLGLVVIPNDAIEICMQYDTSIFSEATVDLLLNRLMNICQQFVSDPKNSLGTIGLLSKKEQMEILVHAAFLEKTMANEDMDLKDFVCDLSAPNEIELLEQLLKS